MASASRSANACSWAAIPRRAAAACLGAGLVLAGGTQRASAQEAAPVSDPGALELKNQCADAYEATQRERAAGRLLGARKAGIFCAQASCPDVLRGDCAKWAAEITSGIPSLVIEARGPTGELLTNVTVHMDGALLGDHLDGRSHEVDPGRHHFRLQAPGFAPKESELTVVEGHETERLSVTLQRVALPPGPRRPVPVTAYVAGGVGALGLASFAYFGLSGNHRKGELSSCQPACAHSLRAPIERDYLAADISLGVSLVSFGISAWLAIASQRRAAEVPALAVRASSDGALFAYRRNF